MRAQASFPQALLAVKEAGPRRGRCGAEVPHQVRDHFPSACSPGQFSQRRCIAVPDARCLMHGAPARSSCPAGRRPCRD